MTRNKLVVELVSEDVVECVDERGVIGLHRLVHRSLYALGERDGNELLDGAGERRVLPTGDISAACRGQRGRLVRWNGLLYLLADRLMHLCAFVRRRLFTSQLRTFLLQLPFKFRNLILQRFLDWFSHTQIIRGSKPKGKSGIHFWRTNHVQRCPQRSTISAVHRGTICTMKRTEVLVLVLIMAIAIGFRFVRLDVTPPGLYPDEAIEGTEAMQSFSTGQFLLFYPNNNGREGLYVWLAALTTHWMGNTAVALRVISAIAGVLTVLGVYLLARRMFDSWELAAMAAFLTATGFWFVNFSRLGFRVILAPLIAVWMFYELYKGFETHRLWHWLISGALLGLGFYTYIAWRVMPLAILLVVGAYWLALRSVFGHGKFAYSRAQMLGGFAALVGISILVFLPLALDFVRNPQYLFERTAQVSVLSSPHPLQGIASNIGKTIGMFFFTGDYNWRHNLSGAPILFWPVAALFAAGFLHSAWRLVHNWRKRGHPGVPQILLLSWLVIGLIPEVLSNEGIPHALRSLIVAPPVYILAAVGLHWAYQWMRKWYAFRDRHVVCMPWFSHAGEHGRRACIGEGTLIVGIATVSLLLAIGIADGRRYFVDWGMNPTTAAWFNQSSVDIAERINALPPATVKYVVVDAGGTLVNGIPMPAQTVMYLTDTFTAAGQAAKHVQYLLPAQYRRLQLSKGTLVFHITQ